MSAYCKYSVLTVAILLCYHAASAQQSITIHVDTSKTFQTIRNFSASDAWSCQFVGSWTEQKKNTIADWLFSMDTLTNGSPKGIGLSMWRYNIGAGSAEQGDSSNIIDEWRRAVLVNGNTVQTSDRIKAQNWFLLAAKKRGVQQFLGFLNSPPVHLTVNGKAHAAAGKNNIDSSQYDAYADYVVNAIKTIQRSTGISFNYISPVNEPQWDWSDNNQEGCPYDNNHISGVVKSFNKSFSKNKLSAKLLITEAGQINYLLPESNKPKRDNQVNEFFNPSYANYVGNLSKVNNAIAAHSYFTTSPLSKAMDLRGKVRDAVAQIKGLEYWQSEYCILGDNDGEINGDKRDLGINAGLYVAKVIYEDLVGANASAWQWWIAVSAYDYKDGLVYVDKNPTDGNYHDSKMLWAMGNYSRFIRPGMQRVDVQSSSNDLHVSAYKNLQNKSLVLVFVNETANAATVTLDNTITIKRKEIAAYITDTSRNLEKNVLQWNNISIPSRSVVTVVLQ
jgi:hypothetical protein